MYSICIPVYRYNVLPLVSELLRQVAEVEGDTALWEILVYDDASPEGGWGGAALNCLSGINYVQLPVNIGRAAIRNKMAREAAGPFLIMLDADAALPANYLQHYQNELGLLLRHDVVISSSDFVIIGGRHYSQEAPKDHRLHLHWWYGSQRESDVGYTASWLAFHSNNFLVNKSLLTGHPFPEDAEGYGHEDTLWGQQFIGSEVKLYRVQNPVIHLGLEANDVFLRKQHQAIRNLHCLKSKTPHLRTRLIDLVEKRPRLVKLAKYAPEESLARYLSNRKKPNLKALDLLKLKWWMEEERRE
ncbi:MAG: glycosyltransferase involved in cell wall biosynthesis [Neolewinella sp.]|jgi:glycosyltransferase involved in cell wall biosynthesis